MRPTGPLRLSSLRAPARGLFLVWLAMAAAGAARAEDLDRGRALAIGECGACHKVTLDGPDGAGPSLIGLVGRPAASQPDYPYSEAMKTVAGKGLVWYRDDIKDYLVPGQTYVTDTIMAYPGLDGQAQRDDLVAYLATLKAPP